MSDRTPEGWVVIKINAEDIDSVDGDTAYKVFAGWFGGYADGDRWRVNSGVESVEEDDDYYYFNGYSGSCYKCHKDGYNNFTMYLESVLDNILNETEMDADVMDEDIDFTELGV